MTMSPQRNPLPGEFLRVPLAHRAFHDVEAGRPENSRAAIRAAIAAGYGIEIDVQPSLDGVAMVFHDYDLKRLTGSSGRIGGRSATELGNLRLIGGEEGIPTLAEVVSLVAGQVPLLIEVKDQDGDMGPNVGPLETSVASDISGYAGPLALMSFNPESIAVLARLAPDRPRGLVTSAYRADDWPLLSAATRDRLRDVPDYDRVGASFVSHEAADLASPVVTRLRDKGAAVLCWTIRSPEAERVARQVAANVTFERYPASIPA